MESNPVNIDLADVPVLQTLQSFNGIDEKLKWMRKYEFYKPQECVGSCYVGESTSLRTKKENAEKSALEWKREDSRIPKVKAYDGRRRKIHDSENYSTIVLKDLLNPDVVFKKKDTASKTNPVSNNEDIGNFIESYRLGNGECLQPIDPDEQLKSLYKRHRACECMGLSLNFRNDEAMQKHLNEDTMRTSIAETYQLVKRRKDIRKFKRYFHKFEENLSTITEDYCAAMGRAFIDYFFSDLENRKALNIKCFPIPHPAFQIRCPVSWHQSVLNSRNFLLHNFFIDHTVLIALRNLWFEKYEEMHIVDKSLLDSLPVDLDSLSKAIEKRCDEFRDILLTKWITTCTNIITSSETMDYIGRLEEKQIRKLFASVYSLMSLQLRRAINNCVRSLSQLLLSYQRGNDFLAEYEDFAFVEQPAIVINLKSIDTHPYVECNPSLEAVQNTVQNVFKMILDIGKSIPRIEKIVLPEMKCSNEYLLTVRISENYIQKIIQRVLMCCEKNFCGPVQYSQFYKPYTRFFDQQTEKSLQNMLRQQSSSSATKNFVEKMDEFINLEQTISLFRREVPLHMINLKCDQFNEAIMDRTRYLQKIVMDFFLDEGTSHNGRIMTRFEDIARISSDTPTATEKLVELQRFIFNSKLEVSLTCKKELVKSAEYLEFLLCYSEVPENFINVNTKLFRWPGHLEHILELASARISHKIEIVEENLKQKIWKFNDVLIDRQKQLDVIKKKDPPVLTLNEMKDTVSHIDRFMSVLKDDVKVANDINTEEDLLNVGTTSYHNLFSILTTLEPFSELWHVVLEFHESYDIWCNHPFINLDAADVRSKVHEMKNVLVRLSKCFYDVPGAKRIVEIVLTKAEKFNVNVPILETICNPGLQERHWEKMNSVIGVSIQRAPETTFMEILNYGVNKHISFLQEINTAATKEYSLENSLVKMKDEWNVIHIQHEIYRDTGMPVLTGIDDIQVMLDDYLLRIQTMRGSLYIGAIEDDVEAWEDKLILMQDVLDLWLKVQSAWLYLEPLFNSEDIMRQMPEESERFNEINRTWNDIMSFTVQNPQILIIIEYPDIMGTLQKSNATLEGIKKGLNEYLEKKRLVFPRFFFLSNHELLEILSESKNFSKINSHLKCFENIASLDMTENFDILGIISSAGEVVPLNSAISPAEAKGIVERWLDQLEDSMIQSLCDINNKAIRNYSTTPLVQWIFQWPAMVSYCALYTCWTADVELSLKDEKLSECRNNYKNVLEQLIALLETDLIPRHRSTTSTLVALLIYLVEIIDDLSKKESIKPHSVHWLKRLRYYNEEQTTYVRMLRATLSYGYEYLGNFVRLIISPQTERCFRLMSGCVQQDTFACLLGTSETGKTEISKDFSKVVAKPYCNFKCCNRVGYKVISTFLKGCVQMGAWVCFDGIDNMKSRELAIIAEEIRSIQLAMSEKSHRFRFENVEVPLNLTCNVTFIFAKMENFNVQLPNNLRKVFRPIMLCEQDHFHIVEMSLRSSGFKESFRLTQQILEVHQLFNQFSFKEHCKSTLRTLKKFLNYMRTLKFKSGRECEFTLAQRAIHFIYSSKFTKQELEFFDDICKAVFEKIPTSICRQECDSTLVAKIYEIMTAKNLMPTETFVRKVIELYDRIQRRQNIIMVGPSFSGKTAACQVMVELFKNSSETEAFRLYSLNPSSINYEQLYGRLDSQTGEWSDGILTKICRECTQNVNSTRTLIIFDGPMNGAWIERIISVLDEKKMCLISGEIIQTPREVVFMFETDSLAFVSPTFIHCCAIVFFECDTLDWRCIFASYMNKLKEKLLDEQIDAVQLLVEWLIPAVLFFLRECTRCKTMYGENYSTRQFTKLMSCILKNEDEEFGFSNVWLQSVILVSIVWSFAAGLSDEDRISFDKFYRKLLDGENDQFPIPEKIKSIKQAQFPKKNTVFDWVCTKQGSETWISWTQMMSNNSTTVAQTEGIFVQTDETANLLYFTRLFFQNLEPILIIGPQGCGKTRTLLHQLHQQSADKYIVNFINLSSHVNANRIQKKVMTKTDRRRKGVYGPPMGKKIILVLDDFETVADHETGESVTELLRQFLEHRSWYNLEDLCRIELIDCIFAGIWTKAEDSPTISTRFLHHVNLVHAKSLTEASISTIFTRMLDFHFENKGFSLQMQNYSQGLVGATLEVYKEARCLLAARPKLPKHFIDSKDLHRVFSGIALMNGQFCQGVDELFRLWLYEMMRVFGDKLSNDTERESILSVIKRSSCHYLRQRTEQYTSHLIAENENALSVQALRKLCFSNFSPNGTRPYDEVPSMETLTKQMSTFVEEYDTENKESISCAIFQFVVECVCIVLRALQKDMGHLLIVRSPGSGSRTILRLAAVILGLKLNEVKITSKYGIEKWRINLKEILWESGIKNTRSLLLLPVDSINDDDMLDDINTLLNTSDLSDIYSSEERSNILSKIMDISHEEGLKLDTTPSTLYRFFTGRIKTNLHVAIMMNPTSSVFYDRLHTCPSFLKCCAVYWQEQGTSISPSVGGLFGKQREVNASVSGKINRSLQGNTLLTKMIKLTPLTVGGTVKEERLADEREKIVYFHPLKNDCRFGNWPDDALEDSANVLLRQDAIFTVNTELLEKCARLCKKIHITATDNVTRCQKKFLGQFHVTPEMFIKFLRMFRVLYKNKIEEISSKQNRYQQGLEKLNFTADQVTSMQAELQILKPKLLETSDSTEKLMVKIEQNTVKMEAAKEIVAADEALANEAAAAAQAIRDDCESDLSEAEPALVSATNALNTLNSSDITVIKAMKNPPSIVKLVLESVCIMKGMKAESRSDVAGNTTDDFWPTSLKLLGDAKFLDNLKSYDKENINPQIMNVIRDRFITHPDFEPDIVKKVSNACEGLCKWVRAMEVYDRVIKIVKPKKLKLANAEAGYASQMEKLNDKRTQLTKVMSKLQVLHDEWAEKTKQKKELEDSIEICCLKLDRAGKLLESLRYEKQRWQELEAELNEDLSRSVGDIFLSSAFITYLTIFQPEFRCEIVKDWHKICQEIQLPITNDYTFSSTFITSDDIKYWNMAGLQTDEASVDNYTVMLKTTQLLFVIDPQGQGKEYIQYLERDNQLKILKASDQNILAELEETILQNTPTLIEEVIDERNDVFISLMQPEFFTVDEKTYLRLNDENIACERLPKIYITTVQPNVHLCSAYNHATLVDFVVNPEQLERRLLKIIVAIDAPELEGRRINWLLKCAEDCQSLCQTEDKILKVLSSTDGNILEDETALQTLNDSKDLLEEIRVKQSRSSSTEMDLKQEYAPFEKVSDLGTRIFFAVINLRQLNPFYEFSFNWFIDLFQQAVKNGEKSEKLENRISLVSNYFIKSVYNELEQVLDEECLLIAQFFITIQMISEKDYSAIVEEKIFGNSFSEVKASVSNKDEQECISAHIASINSSHQPISSSESILSDDIGDYNFALLELKKWLHYYQKQNIIPSTLANALGSKDFIPLVQEFVLRKFLVNDESLDLYDVYHNTDDRIPFICSFTHFDVDPQHEIMYLASEIGVPDDSIKCIPFSKTRVRTELKTIILDAMQKGNWIVVFDFHLLKYAADDMVSLLNEIGAIADVHSQFKLWIITFLDEELPVAIILKGIKITMKDKKYLGPMLHQLYSFTSVHMPHLFENQKLHKNWNFNFFLVCFCHAVLKTVQNHGNFFLEKSYDFTKMNFRSSCSSLELFFDDNEQDTFIEDFIYLLSECNYGANFSSTTDQLMLNTIIGSLKVEKSDRPSFVEILDVRFTIPQDMSFNACTRFILSLPKTNLLEESKLHHLLTLERMQTTTQFWKLARKLYGSHTRTDEKLTRLLMNEVLRATKIVQQFDDFVGSSKDLIYIYLTQEIALYKALVQCIIRTVKYQTRSSAEAKIKVWQKSQINEIPSIWSAWSYPFSNSLKTYILNLNRRLAFLNEWIHVGQPEIMWLSRLFNVHGFLTSVKYRFSKHHNVFLSDVFLHAEVTNFDVDATTSEEWVTFQRERENQNRYGLFVQGLILIGASWNREELTIDASAHENYCQLLPVVWIAPKVHEKYDAVEDGQPCPLYYTHQIDGQQLQFRFSNYITRMNLNNCIRADRTIARQGIRLMLYSDL